MSTFYSTKTRLDTLLNNIVAGEIQLPDFQRGWVWDDEHIRFFKFWFLTTGRYPTIITLLNLANLTYLILSVSKFPQFGLSLFDKVPKIKYYLNSFASARVELEC